MTRATGDLVGAGPRRWSAKAGTRRGPSTSSRAVPFLLAVAVVLALALAPWRAGAITGDWGVTRQAYSPDDCAYVVFLRNELDQTINQVKIRVQFFDAAGQSLGIYELTADTWIEPWTTQMIDWQVPEVCASVERARILKAIASY